MIREIQSQIETPEKIVCLISGGLKSSIIAAVLAKYMTNNGLPPLKTVFIGFSDVELTSLPRSYAKVQKLVQYIGSDHTNVILPKSVFFTSLGHIRNMCVNERDYEKRLTEKIWREGAVYYSVAKWMNEQTNTKTVFLGCGMNTLVGEPNSDPLLYDRMSRENIRSFSSGLGMVIDKCFGSNSLEVRLPFLGRDMIEHYFSMPLRIRMLGRYNIEKCFSLAFSNPFMDRYLNVKIIQSKPKTPEQSAFPRGY